MTISASGAEVATYTGQVTDEETGEPLEGICVDLLPEADWDNIAATALTDASGMFSIALPDPQFLYYLWYEDCTNGNYVSELWDDSQRFYFEPGDFYLLGNSKRAYPTEPHNAALEPAAFATGQVNSPVQPICVFGTTKFGRIIEATVTDSAGSYRLDGLPPGVFVYFQFSDCLHLPGKVGWNTLFDGLGHPFRVMLEARAEVTIPTVQLSPAIESIGNAHGYATTDWEGDGATVSDPVETSFEPNSTFWSIDDVAPPPPLVGQMNIGRVLIEDLGSPWIFSGSDEFVTFEVVSNGPPKVKRDGSFLNSCAITAAPCIVSVTSEGILHELVIKVFFNVSGIYDILTLNGVNPVLAEDFGLVDTTSGYWRLFGTAHTEFFYGNPGDFPFMGDWNCDGVSTPGMYRRSSGYVYVRNSNTQGVADAKFWFGNPGDIPIVGDFDDDGCDTVSIYRPSEGKVYIINELGANDGSLGPAEFSYYFGNPGDKPFAGDFDNDGVDTVGLHRESSGFVYIRNSHTQGVADVSYFFGNPGDQFVTGNWTGNGTDAPAIYRKADRKFYVRFSNTQGIADAVYTPVFATPLPASSASKVIPVAGDFG
jgi:hypothetical protein